MNFWQRFWYSLVGVRRYRTLVAEGLGRALGQICLLILVAVIAFGIRTYQRTHEILDVLSTQMAEWPDFRLADGRFTFTGEMPYIAAGDDMTFIIDTEDSGGMEIYGSYAKGLLLTADKVYFKDRGRPSTTLSWSDLPFETSRDSLARNLPGWLWPILILVVLCLLFYNLAAKGLTGLALGLIGWMAAGGRGLRYSQAFAVSLYALTGPILLALAKNLLYPDLPFFFVLYWGWALAYTVLAALAIKKDLAAPAPMVESDSACT